MLASAAIFSTGRWELDIGRCELRENGCPIPLGGRAIDVLEVLAAAGGRLVPKNELMQRVWPGTYVEDNTLQVHVLAARKALGCDRDMLRTAHGRGYRLLGDWRPAGEHAPPADPVEAPAAPRIRDVGNLPSASGGLIGRTVTLPAVRALVASTRLVTLTGTGGIGKTRLALQAARQCAGTFGDGGWLVELASLSDPRLVPSAVAAALSLELGGAALAAEAVAEAIGDRHILLLLDNCEHVIEPVALLVERILRTCPRVSLLVTSREVLQVEGEHVVRVPPLGLPGDGRDDAADPQERSAVRLFLTRMQAAAAGPPSAAELATIGAICRRLDGIPLAIEFAAARANALGVNSVLGLLNERFSLLSSGRRTALPHHRTLRATLDWSYDMLPDGEARLLRHLSVFPACFTAEAAIAVHGQAGSASEVLQGITNLVDKSLLAIDDIQAGRWRLLETTRAYAREKLAESGAFDAVARAQAHFHRAMMEPTLAAQPQGRCLSSFSRELDNVRAALDWAYTRPEEAETAIVLTAAYVPVWLQGFMMVECGERVEQALRRLAELPDAQDLLRARLLTMLGFALLNTAGRAARTREVVSAALAIAETLDDTELHLRALWVNWSLHCNAGDYRAARPLAERFLAMAHGVGDPAAIGIGHRLLGSVLHFEGDQNGARGHLELALESKDGAPRPIWFLLDQRIMAKAMLARVMALQGNHGEACQLARNSLDEALAADHRLSICYALRDAVCPVALMHGDPLSVAEAMAMLGDLVRRHGLTFWRSWSACMEGQLAVLEGRAGDGVTLLRAGVTARLRAGWNMRTPEFLGSLAEGLAGMGAPGDALEALHEALELGRRDGQNWYEPELLRLRARLMRDVAGHDAAAEVMLGEAVQLAQRQGAHLWHLRAALDMARLLAETGRGSAAAAFLTLLVTAGGALARCTEADALRRFLEGLKPATPDIAR